VSDKVLTSDAISQSAELEHWATALVGLAAMPSEINFGFGYPIKNQTSDVAPEGVFVQEG